MIRRAIAAAGAAAVALGGFTVVHATTITVNSLVPDAMAESGWEFTNFGGSATAEFVTGPATPPAGSGAVKFNQAVDWETGALRTDNHTGTLLADITEFKYSMYWEYTGGTANLFVPPAAQIHIDYDGDNVFDDRLMFDPAWNNGGRWMVTVPKPCNPDMGSGPFPPWDSVTPEPNLDQFTPQGLTPNGQVPTDGWFEWDLLAGSWWSFGGVAGVGTFEAPLVTIGNIAEAFPNAQLKGSGQPSIRLTYYGTAGYDAYFDKLVLNTTTVDTTYDFEAVSLVPGDANEDGVVNGLDLSIMASNWQNVVGGGHTDGDFNDDGTVNGLDLSVLAANWQTGAGGEDVSFDSASQGLGAVPEPASVLLLGGMSLVLLSRRSRRA